MRRVLYICIFMKYLRSYKMQMKIPNLPLPPRTPAITWLYISLRQRTKR